MNEPMRGLELRLPETLTEKLAEAADAGPRTETGAIAAAATPWV